MFRTILSRRRAENARVEEFLDAIRVSEYGTVTEPVTDDTVELPLTLVRLLVPAAVAGALLAGCSSAPAHQPAIAASTAVQVAPSPAPVEQLTGTDAGLITTPAPSVAELEESDRAAAAVTTPAPAAPVTAVEPAPVDVPAVEQAPVTQPDCGQGEEFDPEHGCVAVQRPEERVGGARCEDPTQVVLSVREDGTPVCGVQ